MDPKQIKENLFDMSCMSASPTPLAALKRIDTLEQAIEKVLDWFDTDQSILDDMTVNELADHTRQISRLLSSLKGS
jgi:hypothetical protein